MNFNYLKRIRIISFIICFLAVLFVAKLFFLQVVDRNFYSERADRQYSTPSLNIFERGSIYFKKKDGSLISAATVISGFRVAINPKEITNIEDSYQKIFAVISLDKDEFFLKASKKDDIYEEVANRITKESADQISSLKIPGIYIYKEKWRFYPGNSMAAHSLGFLGFKENDYSGRYGLERQYEDVLSRSKNNLYVNFFAEVFSSIKNTISSTTKKEGDLITTIEPTVQSYLEKTLKETTEKWHAEMMAGIIINPADGSIYAMAKYPNFDLNNFSGEKNAYSFSNPLVENVFEFGSVIKPLTVASGVDAGVVNAKTTYKDVGFVTLDKKTIKNFDDQAHGVVTIQEALEKSLNTGMIYVMQQMGKEKFRDYMYSFGLADKTGIDLPNETKGLTSNLKSTRELEYATASFGQGIAITPINAVRALSVIANGGYMIQPHLVEEIDYRWGKEKKEYLPGKQVIEKKTSEEITRMLVEIIDKELSKGTKKLENYSIAAKTGTAQIAKEGGGGYYEDRHLHSFFGYYPAYDPKFLTFFFLINPKEVKYASETLTDPFIDTAKFLLSYYEVPPDR